MDLGAAQVPLIVQGWQDQGRRLSIHVAGWALLFDGSPRFLVFISYLCISVEDVFTLSRVYCVKLFVVGRIGYICRVVVVSFQGLI